MVIFSSRREKIGAISAALFVLAMVPGPLNTNRAHSSAVAGKKRPNALTQHQFQSVKGLLEHAEQSDGKMVRVTGRFECDFRGEWALIHDGSAASELPVKDSIEVTFDRKKWAPAQLYKAYARSGVEITGIYRLEKKQVDGRDTVTGQSIELNSIKKKRQE